MRQNVKTFLHIFKGSLFPQSSYYAKIPKASFRFSFKYFVCLLILLNSVLILFLFSKYNPWRVNRFLNDFISNLDRYPYELVINIGKNRLFTSYNRPYFFWSRIDNRKKLLLVIDENAVPAKINLYRSYILLTRKEIVLRTNQFHQDWFKIIPLTYLNGQRITKETVQKWTQLLTKMKKLLLLIYLVTIPTLLVFLPLISLIITFFYLLIISLLINIIFKVYFHKKIHFRKTLQISLHAVTLPLLIDYFLNIFRPTVKTTMPWRVSFPTPIAFMILLAVFVFAAVYEAYKNGQLAKKSHPHPTKKH